jgi:hypothetical protein
MIQADHDDSSFFSITVTEIWAHSVICETEERSKFEIDLYPNFFVERYKGQVTL